jgi:hypothetical protein
MMATLPAEQVTQRAKINVVQITDGTEDTTIGETLWLSTTTLPYTVVNTKSVVSDQLVRQTLEDRVMANFYDDKDIDGGTDVSGQQLAKLGDTTLAAASNVTTAKDISPFVSGGFTPLVYTLDATSVIDLAGASAVMAGDTLLYTAGAAVGTDSAVVRVTDQAGDYVLITVAVTVA